MKEVKGENKFSILSIFPIKTWLRLIAIWFVTISFLLFGNSFLDDAMTKSVALVLFSILLTTIIVASFGVVKEADELAHQLMEPFGTLILTLSIVSIEVILISAVLLGPGENPTIGKDSIFSVMMIIMNLVMGVAILLGAMKYKEQEYNAPGTMSYMAMIIVLGGIGMWLPNFIASGHDGNFTSVQAIVLSSFILVLYGSFLFFQMKGYQYMYRQPPKGVLEISTEKSAEITKKEDTSAMQTSTKLELLFRSIVLLAMILPIVLLSHNMASIVDFGIKEAKLPSLIGGVLIAIIVFTPESLTAIKAALNNEFQRAINLCHGAFVSTVGLTVPSVLIIGLITGKTVLLGLSMLEMLLFALTVLLSTIVFIGKRTAPIYGVMHLVLFGVFILLIFNP